MAKAENQRLGPTNTCQSTFETMLNETFPEHTHTTQSRQTPRAWSYRISRRTATALAFNISVRTP